MKLTPEAPDPYNSFPVKSYCTACYQAQWVMGL